MSGENHERVACMFCGEGFAMAAAWEHESICPRNPYIAEIKRLLVCRERDEWPTGYETIRELVIP